MALEKQYNITQPETFEALFRSSNTFMNDGLGLGILAVIWLISFSTFQNWPVDQAVIASTWGVTLLGSLMALFGIISSTLPLLLGVIAIGITAAQYHA